MRKNVKRLILLIILFHFQFLCFQNMIREDVLSRDSTRYVRVLNFMDSGDSFQSVITNDVNIPHLPYCYFHFVHILSGFIGSPIAAGIALNVFSGLVLICLMYQFVYLFARQNLISLLSALLLSVNPSFITISSQPQRDVFCLALIALAVYTFILSVCFNRKTATLFSGFFFSFAIFTRFESIELIPPLFLVLFISLFKRDKIKSRNIAIIFSFLVLTSFVLIHCFSYPSVFEDYYFKLSKSWNYIYKRL